MRKIIAARRKPDSQRALKAGIGHAAAFVAAAALTVTGTGVASASPAHQHCVTVHSLEGAIVRGETITIDGRVYVAHQVHAHRGRWDWRPGQVRHCAPGSFPRRNGCIGD
jgi:hypothetical protein